MKSNGARKRDKVRNNGGMMVDDVEKHPVLACFPIIIWLTLTPVILGRLVHRFVGVAHELLSCSHVDT